MRNISLCRKTISGIYHLFEMMHSKNNQKIKKSEKFPPTNFCVLQPVLCAAVRCGVGGGKMKVIQGQVDMSCNMKNIVISSLVVMILAPFIVQLLTCAIYRTWGRMLQQALSSYRVPRLSYCFQPTSPASCFLTLREVYLLLGVQIS